MAGEGQEFKNPRHEILMHMKDAMNSLAQSYRAAINASAMCASVPVFIELNALQKKLNDMMQEVNKVQGLS